MDNNELDVQLDVDTTIEEAEVESSGSTAAAVLASAGVALLIGAAGALGGVAIKRIDQAVTAWEHRRKLKQPKDVTIIVDSNEEE